MLGLALILAASSQASADIRPLLSQQGFLGPKNGREAIDCVGRIRHSRNEYHIYMVRGYFKAARVNHGINWLIVIRRGGAFFGGYRIPMPARCKIERLKVICDAGIIKFTRDGPPKRIVFDGEDLEFVRRAP